RWIEQVGAWDEKYTNGEDHELAFRVAFAGGRYEFAPSDRPLFFYRRHGPSSLTNRSGQKNAEAWLRLAKFVEEQSRSRNELTPGRRALIAKAYGGCSRWLADYDWPATQVWI